MKIHSASLFACLALASLAASHAAEVTRSSSADNLNLTAAWTGNALPTTADIATWDAASTLANTMGAANTWGGLKLSAASGPVTISGNNTLLLDNATDANTILDIGAGSFTWGVAGTGGGFNINGVAGNTSATSGGATLAGSGTLTISSTGTKNWSTNGTNGVNTIDFTGTLALRGAAIPAIGSPSTNWLALGGGGGAASNAGTLVQIGSFALDTGDETSCGSLILTQAWSGQYLKLNRLQGTGSIRADWGISAGTQTRGIELTQSADTVFSGSIITHFGSGQRRNISLVKKGTGTLTLTGGLGSMISGTPNGPSSLNFDIQEGTIQLGDGTVNPTLVNPNLWDTASTFTIASGATLRFKASAAAFTWPRKLTGGNGTVEITTDGDTGDGFVAFTADNSAFAGNVNVLAGGIRIGPNLGTGTLTVKSGTTLAAGLPTTNGTSTVQALVLEGDTSSDFRFGIASDRIDVTGTFTPPASGTHVINIDGTFTSGGARKLIDFSGNPLSPEEFARFTLGLTPPGAATYQLVNNTADTSLDLLVTLEDQYWRGTVDGNWNMDTTNWAMQTAPLTPVAFRPDYPSVFNDDATTFSVVIEEAGVNPTQTTFNNAVNHYTFTGGELFGNGAVVKNGAAKVTLANNLGHSGGTVVNAGTLTLTGTTNISSGGTTLNGGALVIGDGGTTGDLGSGPVSIAAGTSLTFNRSNAVPGTIDLDYKTSTKLRSVSGSGDIHLTGGAILFNYTGSGLGFAEANSWSTFSGNLKITGGSEFRTIRNGATAMGTGTIILGDASSSGTLAQIEGNWTWTNPIQLVGASNTITNYSGAGAVGRLLKLQGVLSGTGGLIFADNAAPVAMTDPNRGYILTAENTLSGAITINPGVPVRVGGVPGNTDANQPNAAPNGTLGTATVTNNGFLTLSRTDTHTVANNISGSGQLRIGIPAAANLGDTTTQVVTLTGNVTQTGGIIVNSGTLIIPDGKTLADTPVTVAAAGTLAGSGSVATATNAAGTLTPGISGIGTLTTGDTTLTGTYRCDVTGATSDVLVAANLDLTGATLTVNAETPTATSYTIATYSGTLTGTFATVPEGYQVDYATPGQVKLVKAGTDYDSWIAGFSLQEADRDPGDDPDGDGLTNRTEYAFGLNPASGSSASPVTAPLNRSSATFTYSRRKPNLTGITSYRVWTSTNLTDWTEDTGATQTATDAGDNQSVTVTLSQPAPLSAPATFVRVSVE